jgi:hypothetical protein
VAENIYVTPSATAIPLEVFTVDITNGHRERLLSLFPSNPTGTMLLFPPLFTPDHKRYVYTQIRVLSTLYSATDLK